MLSHRFSIVCIVLSVISTIFVGVTLISANNNSTVLKDLYWSVGSFNSDTVNYDVYIGVYELGFAFAVNNDDNFDTLKYTDSGCTPDFCDKCESGNQASLGFVALFFILSLPPLLTNCRRFSETGNTSLMRWTGIVTASLSIFCGALAMIIYAAGCEKSVQDYYHNDTTVNIDLDWTYGPAFGLIAAACVLKFLELIFSIFIGSNNGTSLASTAASSTSNPTAAAPTPAVVVSGAAPPVAPAPQPGAF